MAPSNTTGPPRVSVIVPARNEEATLGPCLQSLVEQQGVAFEVIVVDDASSDRTREIAQQFPSVKVLEAPALPPGRTGKNNALIAGAISASGEWLLFTDADTIHAPGSLLRSLQEAQRLGVSLLSYSPRQEVQGIVEKSVMPVIFAELAATYRPAQVSDPLSPAAAANGQYLLIRREAYTAVGGHAAIAASILEDVALARAVKRSGRKIFFRYGADAVRTRMYRSFAQLREGWTKNLVLLFPAPGRLAVLRFIEFLLIATSGIFLLRGSHRERLKVVFAAVLLIALGLFWKRIRKAHFSWDANLLALFGLPIFSYLLLRSKLAHATGNVTWKGRLYAGKTAGLREATAAPAPGLVEHSRS
ncbi:MAG TPA: glycosyltransferase [Terriglobales bacterium]|nr:glycosyltransferase [Terriglobales bacterium]